MTARALLKTGISASLAWSGGAMLVGRATGKHRTPLVLGYHRVVDDYGYSSRYAIPSSLVSTKTLIRQLEWIARRYEICSLDELHQRSSLRGVKPVAAITFDDGYADVYHNAFPALMGKGMPFTVFATTDLIGKRDLFAHDELYLRLSVLLSEYEDPVACLNDILRRVECRGIFPDVCRSESLKPYRLTRAMLGAFCQREVVTVIKALRPYTELPVSVAEQSYVMNWEMLMKMQRAGVLIGCHSKSHAILTHEDNATAFSEVKEARDTLETRLGVPVRHFAYPDGAFNDAVVRLVAEAGYSYAYTVCSHRSGMAPKLTVSRRMLWEKSNVGVLGKFSGSVMNCLINGVFDSRSACATEHG